MALTFKNARVSTILPLHNSSGRQYGYRVGHSVSSRKCWIPNLGTEPLSACDRGTGPDRLIGSWRHVTPALEMWGAYRYVDREFQKKKLYTAERSLADVRLWGYHEATSTPLDTARFLDKVIHSATFQRRWGQRSIRLRYVAQLQGAHALIDTISLPTRERIVTPLLVLHELAHCVCPTWERHGRLFAATYLELVRLFHPDKLAYSQLKEAFRSHGIKKNARRTPRSWETWKR
jgi:hypothetical protein